MPSAPIQQRFLQEISKGTAAPKVKSAAQWFKSMAIATATGKYKKDKRNIGVPTIGDFCSFVYDAKGKNKLEYWDKFPLVIVIELYDDGFLGLNLHYLPPKLRAVLLEQLMAFSTGGNTFNDRTKIAARYKLLAGVKKFRLFEPCLKRYLAAHVRSSLMKIYPDEWHHAVFLPFEQFVGAGKSKVWSDSLTSL